MQFIKIHTRVFMPPKDNLFMLIDEYLPYIKDGDILLVTSKILAIHQGRCIKADEKMTKDTFAIQESEKYLPQEKCPGKITLTIKNHTLLPSAGVDSSNADGYYVLWPEDIIASAKEIWEYLRTKYGIEKLGIIITDSCSVLMRQGVVGISIGFYGFNPLIDHTKKKDIFGKQIPHSKSNIPDALASVGVLMMGESNEQTPLMVIRGFTNIEFVDYDMYNDFVISNEKDIFSPLFKEFLNGGKAKQKNYNNYYCSS